MGAIDAIRTVQSIDDPIMAYTPRQKENRIAKSLIALSDYYRNMLDEVLSGKPGMFRKHVFGTRNHFSMRNVITSLTKSHRYDELHVPWGAAVTTFKLHLMNKLLKRGFTINTATALLNRCVYRFDPLVNELFNELFAESKHGGWYCLFQRNGFVKHI
jgi:DNA-directed RNA polymerase beta' subunit